MLVALENMAWVAITMLYVGACLQEAHCQKNQTVKSLRIYKGEVVKMGELPYIVYVTEMANKKSCTGGLIHAQWVLTAAHCIVTINKNTEACVYGGIVETVYYLMTKDTRKAKKIIKHPHYDYNFFGSAYDYMLIQVETPFELHANLKIIPISGDPWPADRYNVKCVAAGFGDEDTDVTSRYLRKSEVIAKQGPEGCPGGCYSATANEKLICLKRKGRICKGDSGGLLACNGKAVGVAHALYVPGDCGKHTDAKDAPCQNTLSIFMFICDELEWIGAYVPGMPKKPASCSNSSSFLKNSNITGIIAVLFFIKRLKIQIF